MVSALVVRGKAHGRSDGDNAKLVGSAADRAVKFVERGKWFDLRAYL
jgi:hypothetical protein